jgi:hypothetical protein
MVSLIIYLAIKFYPYDRELLNSDNELVIIFLILKKYDMKPLLSIPKFIQKNNYLNHNYHITLHQYLLNYLKWCINFK